MPDLNQRFQAGRMNKDLDERLVPNGEYRDALNVEVATSEGSEVGAMQTIMGSFDISTSSIDPNGTLNGYCVGSIANEKEDKLYWLIAGNGRDIIAEYDFATKVVTPIVVDIFPVNTVAHANSGRVLNFDRSFLITGINIIDDILFWTDNNTEPKRVNMTRAKMGSPDFVTHTQFYIRDTQTSGLSIIYIPVGPIKQEHITVIRKSPPNAPVLEMKSTTRGDLDQDNVSGEILGLISDTDIAGGMFLDSETGEFTTDPVSIVFMPSPTGSFDATPDYKPWDYIIISHVTDEGKIAIRCQIQPDNFTIQLDPTGMFQALYCEVKILSGDPGITSIDGFYNVELEQATEPLFQFKYPRFAYRYKYEDGEYSSFSPFTEPAFLPGNFDYMPKEGYNLAMVNQLRYLAIKNFVDERIIPDDVISVDILYKESNSSNIYSVKTIKRIPVDAAPPYVYDEWNAISPTITDRNSLWKTKGYLEITSEMIHAVLPANQLLRPWDNVPRKALAQEVIGNRLVYGNYLQNYDLFNHGGQRIKALKRLGSITGWPGGIVPSLNDIQPKVNLTLSSHEVGNVINEELNAGIIKSYRTAKSIKTLRTYQVGVVYRDEYGRETPVFSTNASSITVPKDTADRRSILKAQVLTPAPEWAESFKFFVKETSNEYYNLAMDRWYDAEDGNIWLSFSSSERNKVDEETFLILKKEHDSTSFIKDPARYKILAIENEAPLFVKTEKKHKGVFVDDGSKIGLSSGTGFPLANSLECWLLAEEFEKLNWAGPDQTEGVLFAQDLSLFEIRFSTTAGFSKWQKIKTINYEGTGDNYYVLTFERPLTEDCSITSTDNTFVNRYQNVEIDLMKSEVHNKPEFEGRFFVKILKDQTLIDKIIHPSEIGAKEYSVTHSIKSTFISPSSYTAKFTSLSANGDWYNTTITPQGTSSNVSISEKNGPSTWFHSPGNPGVGETYWKAAGNDKDAVNSVNDSSGWFIDEVEGFRRYKTTKHWVSGKDESYATHATGHHTYVGSDTVIWGNYDESHSGFGATQQLQLIGTNTIGSGPNTQYLNQPNVIHPKTHLLNSSDTMGGIVPSLGIDTTENIIHLSYAGIGEDGGGGNYDGTTTSLYNHFAASSWANKYVTDLLFIEEITTPGAIWRWKEDPDQVIYQTLTYPGGAQDAARWSKNTTDLTDSEPGVGLYNYGRFADYAVKYHHKHEIRGNIPGGWTYLARHDHANFVSQNITDHNTYHGGWAIGWPTGWAVAFNSTLHSGLSAHTTSSSGGWGWGPWTSGWHKKWAMMTEDWKKPWNKRRRFQFHAKTLIVDPTTAERYDLGAIPATSNYLPTNSCDPTTNPPHFDQTGTVFTSVPVTAAPGIRPDGMYSGHANPGGGTWTLTGFDSGTAQSNIPHLYMEDAGGTVSPPPGTVTWEILQSYAIWTDDKYTSTNPAIWETEPKEDVGLDIYYEVGQIYPTELNDETIEQFVGPVGPDLILNSSVTCRTVPGTGNPTGIIDLRTAFFDNVKEFDIRVAGVNGNNVLLEDIMGNPLDASASQAPSLGNVLVFTRANGSSTEAMVDQIIDVGGVNTNEYRLDPFVHNYQVSLPWFNCYSFGNGVESDRIRDDFNQVTIDDGAKASTTLEEPYEEERRPSGLIYSGIYNSTSGVNDLNQFIQAEKITKDLNPVYGSIQKLHARNTDLLTLCEDKVFKILAHKDALYNADGNMNLTATENVLGQITPLMGEYGISKNPESFASESYRAYFTDQARGTVIRLSQDGITPISDAGMKDYFADTLTSSTRLIGSVDDRKSEYNLTVDYSDYPISTPENIHVANWVTIEATQRGPGDPWFPTGRLLIDYATTGMHIGDIISGPGIPAGAVITNIVTLGPGQPKRIVISPPIPETPSWLNQYWGGDDPLWGTYATITHPATIVTPGPPSGASQTVTFSEKSKGWVSFKSWIKENGISLNNSYYTFKGGNINEHHVNTTRNNFYGQQYDSSVRFLFNEIPGSVKSFQTLNYEGSQSKVTPDGGLGQTSHSGEYWDNYLKTGWYVHNMYTNLQQASLHEFRNKEGKWFADIKGVATEWLDDGSAGNIDTKEFSYQGIDEAGLITTVSGGYTSWDCIFTPDPSPCGLIDTSIVVEDDWNGLPGETITTYSAGNYWTAWSRPNTTNDPTAFVWPGLTSNTSEWLNALLSWAFEHNIYDTFDNFGIYVCQTNVVPTNCLGYFSLQNLMLTNPFTGATVAITSVSDLLTHFNNVQYPGCDPANSPQCIGNYWLLPWGSSNPYQDFINLWTENSNRAAVWDQTIFDANQTGMTDYDSVWDNTVGYTSIVPTDFNYFGNDPNQWYLSGWSVGPICEVINNELNYTCTEIVGQGGAYLNEPTCQADTNTACGGAGVGWECIPSEFTCGGYAQIMTGSYDSADGSVDYSNPGVYTVCATNPADRDEIVLSWFFNDPLKQNLEFKDFAYLRCDDACLNCVYERIRDFSGFGAKAVLTGGGAVYAFTSVENIIDHFLLGDSGGTMPNMMDFPNVYHFMNYLNFKNEMGTYNSSNAIVERVTKYIHLADCTDQTILSGDACMEQINGQYETEGHCISSPTCSVFDPCEVAHDVVPVITDATNTGDPLVIPCEDGMIDFSVVLNNGSTQWTVRYVSNFMPYYDDPTLYSGNTNATTLANLIPGDYHIIVTDDLGCESRTIVTVDCINTDPCPNVPVVSEVITQPSGYGGNGSCTGDDGNIQITVTDLLTATSWTWEVFEIVYDPVTGNSTNVSVYTDATNYVQGDTVNYAPPAEGYFIYVITTDEGCVYGSYGVIVIECDPNNPPCSVEPTFFLIPSDAPGTVACCDTDDDGIPDGGMLGDWITIDPATGNPLAIPDQYANCEGGGVAFTISNLNGNGTTFNVELQVQNPVDSSWSQWSPDPYTGAVMQPGDNMLWNPTIFGLGSEPGGWNGTPGLSWPLAPPSYGLSGYNDEAIGNPDGPTFSAVQYQIVVTTDTGCVFEYPFEIDCPYCPDNDGDGFPDFQCAPGGPDVSWAGCCCDTSVNSGYTLGWAQPNGLACQLDPMCTCMDIPGSVACNNSPTSTAYCIMCFVAGTKITMENDLHKNIEDIKVGDMVKSWNEDTNNISSAKVIELFQPIHDDMVIFTFDNGENENTFDHPYYVKGKGWCSYKPELTMQRYNIGEIKQLEVGDVCYKYNNGILEEIILKDMKENIKETQTYIFKLEKDYTFFANDVLTHNK